MADTDSFQNLVAARTLLRTSLEKSITLASALEKTGPRLEEIKQRLPSLEAAVHPLRARKWCISAVGGHISRAVGPATAVLKVFDAIHGLEKSLRRDPSSDLHGYLLAVKRLEEAFRFLAENCGLAIKWLEDVVEFLKDKDKDKDNAAAAVVVGDDDRYLSNVIKCTKILKELQANEERARLDGGILSVAYDKLEAEFGRILRENSLPLPIVSSESSIVATSSFSVSVIQKLQVVIERLSANNRLESCVSTYIDVRTSNVRECLEPLGLDYLEMSVFEFDNLEETDSRIDKWSKDLTYYMNNLLEIEYELCDEVFKNNGSNVSVDCFVRIATESGFLDFIRFGNTVAESKKDAVKLFKLLKIFHTLNELRLDFNRLFGGKSCNGIQTPTRNLVKEVIHGACEIFWEILPQVEVHRGTSPPLNGGVPRLVSFVHVYCNQLLEDDFRPTMIQILEIHQNWQHQRFREGILREEVCNIMEAIRLNIDAWSKSYEDASLSYIFLINNHSHLYKALKGTSLGDLVGESQLREHEKKKDHYTSIYLRENWGFLPNLLGDEDETLFSNERQVKKKMKAFHEVLDGTYKKQSNWVVADESLRKRICKLVVDKIVPVYKSYIHKYGDLIEQDGSKYVNIYSEEGLVNMLSSMFRPRVRKCYSTNSTRHSIDKMGEMVTNSHFPSTTFVT